MVAAAFKCWKICFVQEALFVFCMLQEVELEPLSIQGGRLQLNIRENLEPARAMQRGNGLLWETANSLTQGLAKQR